MQPRYLEPMHFILTIESGRLQHVPGMRASGFFEDSEGWYLSNLKYVEGEREMEKPQGRAHWS